MRKATDRVRKFGGEVFEALTFGAGMLAALAMVWNVGSRSTGYVWIAVSTVALLMLGVAVAWRWRRYGPLAGMVLALTPVWLIFSMTGPAGTGD